MDNKVKYTIHQIITYILIPCMFVPIAQLDVYTRKTGKHFKYDILVIIATVLLCIFLIWLSAKLLGVNNSFVRKDKSKPNWINHIFTFFRVLIMNYAFTKSRYTALYALTETDKNPAVQKIYTIYVIAVVIIMLSALVEEIYNKKRETENENQSPSC